MVEKFPVYHHFFTIISVSLTSKKRAKSLSTLPSPFPLITEKSLSDVGFSVENIKNISKFDSNKAHDDDMISIRMLKICDNSICKPLSIIFKSCLTQGIFPSEWKKQMSYQFIKKTTNSVLKTTGLSLFSQSVAKF